jgi:dihydrofolate reductase
MISLIVAMAHDRVIGKDNGMPWHLPADLKHFKAITSGHPVIMGRKTFESIGKALPNRRNIVVSRHAEYIAPGAEVVGSLESALNLVHDHKEIFVIGGAQLFTQALPLAEKMYLTYIDLHVEGDTFFPEWDHAQWQETSREFFNMTPEFPHTYAFVDYERRPA